MKKIFLTALLPVILGVVSCSDVKVYQNPEAGIDARVEDLLGRMTLEEKIYQVTQWTYGKNMNENNVETSMKQVSPMIGSLLYRSTSPEYYNRIQRKAMEESRLGIPILCGFDVIHGYRTIFPIPLAQSCSWNTGLVEESCAVAASESRKSGVFWTFSPMVDVARDFRWGRVAEGYGEDPYLNGVMGVAAVKGYQGDDLSDPNSIAACLKHFVGYAYSQGGRDYQYSEIAPQALWETAMPPFEMGVRAGAATLMSAFNDISGIPASCNRYTLTEVLRDEWGFDGFVVSDWGSVSQLMNQGVAADTSEACYKAITAGVDMDMVDDVYLNSIEDLIVSGKLDESILDEAVRRILRIKFRLGLFENPYIEELPENERYLSDSSRSLARKIAVESMVLLKNSSSVLPLAPESGSIAVMGPLADNQADMMGSWWGQGEASDVVTILKGIEEQYDGIVRYTKGCPFEGNDRSGFNKAKALAGASDYVVLCMGENRRWSGENASRAKLSLPDIQLDFIREISAVGTPVIVLISSGRPVELKEISELSNALVAIWQPGTEAGNAVADILFGRENPSGKLSVTFPVSAEQQPVYYNQRPSSRPSIGHYQDITRKPLYEFGYGLSYTQFEYGNIRLDKTSVGKDGTVVAEVDVTNTGVRDGKETVLWFIQDPVATISRPVKELKHFEKKLIRAGETVTYRFEITPGKDLYYYNDKGDRILEPGQFNVIVNGEKCKFELE